MEEVSSLPEAQSSDRPDKEPTGLPGEKEFQGLRESLRPDPGQIDSRSRSGAAFQTTVPLETVLSWIELTLGQDAGLTPLHIVDPVEARCYRRGRRPAVFR